ncbi:hypothetical protein FACS189465_1500 [Clostridia bacterium]|nr:hypothetical protein FACS189465_1500 [Clostridia bacterium]
MWETNKAVNPSQDEEVILDTYLQNELLSDKETNKMIGNLQNGEFVEKLFKAKTDNEIKALFLKQNTEISDKQLKGLKLLFTGVFEKVKTLSKDELENISGGISKDELKSVGKKSLIWSTIGLGLGALYGVKKGLDTEIFLRAIGRNRRFSESLGTVVLCTAKTALNGATLGALVGGVAGISANMD